ncbi:MAG: hypothetical protein ACJ76H_09795 [Bacteriovoracaceae bacterium]
MKTLILAILALSISAETFAQRGHAPRGPRYNPIPDRHDHFPGRIDPRPDYRPGPGRIDPRPDYRPGGRIIIRNTYRPGRVYRTYRRPPIIWSVPFGYSCSMYGDLLLNGVPVHKFRINFDCYSAVDDIRIYGDYCDDDVMFDQSGYQEAQFYSNVECREALGYYY